MVSVPTSLWSSASGMSTRRAQSTAGSGRSMSGRVVLRNPRDKSGSRAGCPGQAPPPPRMRLGTRRFYEQWPASRGEIFICDRAKRTVHFRGEIALSGMNAFFAARIATVPRERVLPEVVSGESTFCLSKRAIGEKTPRFCTLAESSHPAVLRDSVNLGGITNWLVSVITRWTSCNRRGFQTGDKS